MINEHFSTSISAKISAREAINRINKVQEWWGVSYSGDCEKQNDKFIIKMGGDSFFNFSVAELIPGKKVVWLVTDCNMPWYADKKEWANTKLIFDVCENNAETSLHFTHEGLIPGIDCYMDCKTGWTHWIGTSLLSYFSTGKGQFKKKVTQIYHTGIEVPYSPTIVFNSINNVSKWWPEEFEGESTKLGDEFVFRSGDMHSSKQKLVELVPDKKVVWLVTESLRKTDNYEWTGTKMIFELNPEGSKTLVSFTYDGPVLENESDRLIQVCDMVIKKNLYNYITEGK